MKGRGGGGGEVPTVFKVENERKIYESILISSCYEEQIQDSSARKE